MTSHQDREEYGLAKGGGRTMDLSRVATEYLHLNLETVAAMFLVGCALTPVAAFLIHRFRRRRK
jgi:hypothetical protein